MTPSLLTQLPSRYTHPVLLARGGMGEVHVVTDVERDEKVALKIHTPWGVATSSASHGQGLSESQVAGRFLFRQEFWSMAALSHPHLVAAYDFGETPDGLPFFTMAYVPGIDLAECLPQDEQTVRAWLPGVLAALGFLHQRGFVHGDLKPENIRIHPDAGGATLMDLGLLSISGQPSPAVSGSLPYMAPETIKQGTLDGRADLYALGAVLYHALAGRAPFAAPHAVGWLRAHLDEVPVPLQQRVAGISDALASVVMRLLAKDPAQRPRHTGEVAALLGLPLEGEATASLLTSPLIGREACFGELRDELATEGATATWLEGREGFGKTRLLAEMRATAQLGGLTAIAIRGQGTDAAPYAAVRAWLGALAATSPDPVRDRLAPVLLKLLPELADACPGLQAAPALDPSPERLRLHAAVAEWVLSRIGPAAWLVDDADRLDPPSRELLDYVRQQGGTARWHWLFAGQQAPDEGGGAVVRRLAPFTDGQVYAQASAMLGQATLPPEVAARLPLVTGGSPGAVAAVLGHWIQSGALYRTTDLWESRSAETFDLPGDLQVVLDARFQSLDDDARRVGRTAALLGQTASLHWLAALVPISESSFFGALLSLERAGVLACAEGEFRFLRLGQADMLAATFAANEAALLHSAAAAWLEARPVTGAERPFGMLTAIAGHHLRGEMPATGIPWVLEAARRSLEFFAPDPIERLLRRALALADLPAGTETPLRTLLADVLRLRGRVDEALVGFETEVLPQLRATRDPQLHHHLATTGLLYSMKSRYPEAIAVLAEAINLADAAQDLPSGVRARGALGRVAYFAGHTASARTHLNGAVRRAREGGILTNFAALLGLHGLLLATTVPGGLAEGLAAMEEACELNRAVGDHYGLFESLSNLGNVHMANGSFAQAVEVFGGCLDLAIKYGFDLEMSFAHLNVGAALLERGELADAAAHAASAIAWSRRQKRKFPEGFSLALQGVIALYRGQIAEGLADTENGLAIAREIGNKYLELNVLVYRAEALVFAGQLRQAESALADAGVLAAETHNEEHNAKLDRLSVAVMVLADSPVAWSTLAAQEAALRERDAHTALAYVLRWQGEWLVRAGEHALADEVLLEAAGLATGAGLALLEIEVEWLRAALAGATLEAAAHYKAGWVMAERLEYRLFALLCQWGFGQSDPAQRGTAHEARRLMRGWLAPLSVDLRDAFLSPAARAAVLPARDDAATSLPTERLYRLAELMAAVAEQPTLEGVIEKALAALVEIADAERAYLVLNEDGQVIRQAYFGMRPEESDDFSRSLVYRVLWSGEPLYLEDAQAIADLSQQGSIRALQLRSALGVPLIEHDPGYRGGGSAGADKKVIGVMLADSRRLAASIGQTELDLALLLARQVAATVTMARKLAAYRQGYEAQATLGRLSLAMLAQGDPVDWLSYLCHAALGLVDADRVMLLEGPQLAVRLALDSLGRELDPNLPFARIAAREAFAAERPIQVAALGVGIHTVIAVPVILPPEGIAAEGEHTARVRGVLYLDGQRLPEIPASLLSTLESVGEMLAAILRRA